MRRRAFDSASGLRSAARSRAAAAAALPLRSRARSASFLECSPGLGVRPQRCGGTMPGALVGMLLAGERNGEGGVGSAPIGRRCRCVRG